jgi:glycosyltransferase involved in cell wall biosynthesis
MRILLISSRFHPYTGGVENVVFNLAKQFQAKGSEVQIAASQMGIAKKSEENVEGIEVRRVWINLPRSVPGFLAFKVRFARGLANLIKLVSKFRPDVINYHFPDDSSVYVYLLLKTKRVPLVLNIHGNDLQIFGKKAWYGFFLKKLVGAAQTIIVNSNYIKGELLKDFPKAKGKVRIIPNGVKEVFFQARGAKPQDYALFLGRLAPKKAVDILLAAFASVSEKIEETLYIVGDGEEREKLEALTKTLKIDNRVRFLGTKKGQELLDLISGARFAVIPSRREPFGIVALELMAAGKAIIAARTGGLAEILENEKTALLFENENAEELASKMLELAKDANLRAHLAGNARKEAEGYRWEKIAEQYTETYKHRT